VDLSGPTSIKGAAGAVFRLLNLSRPAVTGTAGILFFSHSQIGRRGTTNRFLAEQASWGLIPCAKVL
jgi:hypothetical protein